MERAILLLDPAHGIDVTGKASPDNSLQEWDKSRRMIFMIKQQLEKFKKDFFVASPFLGNEMEPGLRNRVDHYNQFCKKWDRVVVLSNHIDAAPDNLKDETGWADDVRGTTIFTSRGETDADPFATILGESIQSIQPEEKYRWDYGLGREEIEKDLDREANFTIIAGYWIDRSKPISEKNWQKVHYDGILLENGFMTSHDDVKNLLDPKWIGNRVDGIVKGIMDGFHSLGLAPDYL